MNCISQKTTSFCSETRGNAENPLGIQLIQETFGELLVLWLSQCLNFAVSLAKKSQRSSLQVWGWGRSRVLDAGSPSHFNTSLIDLSVRCSATGEQNSVPSHIVYSGQRCQAVTAGFIWVAVRRAGKPRHGKWTSLFTSGSFHSGGVRQYCSAPTFHNSGFRVRFLYLNNEWQHWKQQSRVILTAHYNNSGLEETVCKRWKM